MSDLPEITAIEFHKYEPGDMFIIHVDEFTIGMEEAQEIQERFRAVTKLPDDVPIVVFNDGMRIEVVRNE